MSDDTMLVATSRDAGRSAKKADLKLLSAELSVAVQAMVDALAAQWDRGLRRLVFTLPVLIVGSAAVAVIVA